MRTFTRRELLRIAAASGLSVTSSGMLVSRIFASTGAPSVPNDPSSLAKFVDALPLPGDKAPTGTMNGIPHYVVTMKRFTQQLHRDLPPTTLFGYDGLYPGLTIHAKKNRPLSIEWVNDIDATEYLIPDAYDATLHGNNMGEPHVRTVVHVHGAHVEAKSDGDPEAWYTRGYAQTGPHFANKIYTYSNKQDAASLWYHDHALGMTRLNVVAGLAGLYLVHDPLETSLNLPKKAYEIPLLIQDRTFDKAGQLLYTINPLYTTPVSQGLSPDPNHPGPWNPEFFGDTMLVNGKIWPYLDVEPRKYRFRVYNGCNARFINLSFGGLPMYQIAAEQGFFDQPVPQTSILLSPAERADIIVDFTGLNGKTFVLTNDAPTPYPVGDPVDANTSVLMQVRVTKPLQSPDTSSLPTKIQTIRRYDMTKSYTVRYMALNEWLDKNGNSMIVLTNNKHYDHPVTTRIPKGSIEIWNIINTTMDMHPIHLHLVRFQVLDIQPFDVNRYLADWIPMAYGSMNNMAMGSFNLNDPYVGMGPDPIPVSSYLLGSPTKPDANMQGWKDTVRVPPGTVVRIIADFSDYTGVYPWHCHIVDHEDNDMMGRFEVY